MSEILSIEKLREMAFTIIDIPNFDNAGTIKVKVQKPRLMTMASQGEIPNHLLGVVNNMVSGREKEKKEPKIEDVTKLYELYCRACLVEPTYDEFKGIITDDQMEALFDWAMGGISQLDTFREDKGNGTSNNNGKTLQEKTE